MISKYQATVGKGLFKKKSVGRPSQNRIFGILATLLLVGVFGLVPSKASALDWYFTIQSTSEPDYNYGTMDIWLEHPGFPGRNEPRLAINWCVSLIDPTAKVWFSGFKTPAQSTGCLVTDDYLEITYSIEDFAPGYHYLDLSATYADRVVSQQVRFDIPTACLYFTKNNPLDLSHKFRSVEGAVAVSWQKGVTSVSGHPWIKSRSGYEWKGTETTYQYAGENIVVQYPAKVIPLENGLEFGVDFYCGDTHKYIYRLNRPLAYFDASVYDTTLKLDQQVDGPFKPGTTVSIGGTIVSRDTNVPKTVLFRSKNALSSWSKWQPITLSGGHYAKAVKLSTNYFFEIKLFNEWLDKWQVLDQSVDVTPKSLNVSKSTARLKIHGFLQGARVLYTIKTDSNYSGVCEISAQTSSAMNFAGVQVGAKNFASSVKVKDGNGTGSLNLPFNGKYESLIDCVSPAFASVTKTLPALSLTGG